MQAGDEDAVAESRRVSRVSDGQLVYAARPGPVLDLSDSSTMQQLTEFCPDVARLPGSVVLVHSFELDGQIAYALGTELVGGTLWLVQRPYPTAQRGVCRLISQHLRRQGLEDAALFLATCPNLRLALPGRLLFVLQRAGSGQVGFVLGSQSGVWYSLRVVRPGGEDGVLVASKVGQYEREHALWVAAQRIVAQQQ